MRRRLQGSHLAELLKPRRATPAPRLFLFYAVKERGKKERVLPLAQWAVGRMLLKLAVMALPTAEPISGIEC